MSGEPIEIQIGRRSEGVLVRVLGREQPGADDSDDGNWLVTPIEVRVGGFVGQIEAHLRAEEIRRFRVELERIYRDLSGDAVLASLEGWISLEVKCQPNGTLAVQGAVNDRPGDGNELKFTLPGLDQSDLPSLIAALLACEEAFPVLGERRG